MYSNIKYIFFGGKPATATAAAPPDWYVHFIFLSSFIHVRSSIFRRRRRRRRCRSRRRCRRRRHCMLLLLCVQCVFPCTLSPLCIQQRATTMCRCRCYSSHLISRLSPTPKWTCFCCFGYIGIIVYAFIPFCHRFVPGLRCSGNFCLVSFSFPLRHRAATATQRRILSMYIWAMCRWYTFIGCTSKAFVRFIYFLFILVWCASHFSTTLLRFIWCWSHCSVHNHVRCTTRNGAQGIRATDVELFINAMATSSRRCLNAKGE